MSCESQAWADRCALLCTDRICISLPAGTLLPYGASFAMQATVDFGLHFPVRSHSDIRFMVPQLSTRAERNESAGRLPPPCQTIPISRQTR